MIQKGDTIAVLRLEIRLGAYSDLLLASTHVPRKDVGEQTCSKLCAIKMFAYEWEFDLFGDGMEP